LTTSNLGLAVYNEASGSAVLFLTYRLALADTTSNMSIIDNFAGETSASIIDLQSNMLININASQSTPNVYLATSSLMSSYATNVMLNVKFNASVTGATTLNINSLGAKTIKKVNVDSGLIDLSSGDIRSGRYYLMIYNGTYFILMSPVSGNQINISGSTLNFVSISGSNVLTDSGVPVLTGITTGSYTIVQVDSYGRVTSGSVTEPSSTISGSSVMSNTTGSEVRHNPSGITSGSYGTVFVDIFGHATSGSPYGSSILNEVVKTDSYTLLTNDCVCLASGSSIITLPTAVGAMGKTYRIKNIGVGTITLSSTSGSVDNLPSQSLSTMDSATVISDNTNWWII